MCSTAEGVLAAVEVASADLLRALDEVDVAALSDPALADSIVSLTRLTDALSARVSERLAVFDARGAAATVAAAPSTAAWLRAACRRDPGAANVSVAVARAMSVLSATAQAWREGAISGAHARAVASVVPDTPPEQLPDAEAVLLDLAHVEQPRAVRVAARVLREALAPEAAAADFESLRERRTLSAAATFEGMVVGSFTLDPEAGARFLSVLDPLAAPKPGPDGEPDPRSAGQRRADALDEACRRLLGTDLLPARGGEPTRLLLTAELTTLAHGIDLADPDDPAGGLLRGQRLRDRLRAVLDVPGLVPTVGGDVGAPLPVPVPVARRLACNAGITSVLLGPDSEPLDLGRTVRLATRAQRAALLLRDGGCAFPTCDRPAGWTDIHHRWEWSAGGPTDLDHLAPLCSHHHHAVHDDGWTLTRRADGTWTAHPPPAGHVRRRRRRRRHDLDLNSAPLTWTG